jgi:hypothetical protein
VAWHVENVGTERGQIRPVKITKFTIAQHTVQCNAVSVVAGILAGIAIDPRYLAASIEP